MELDNLNASDVEELLDEKSIEQFLTLTVNMDVALLHGDGPTLRCAGIGKIVKCFLKGTWEGFQVPYNFYVVLKLGKVNHDFLDQMSYCQIPQFTTFGKCIDYLIL